LKSLRSAPQGFVNFVGLLRLCTWRLFGLSFLNFTIFVFLYLWILPNPTYAASVKLVWSPSPGPGVAGYRIYIREEGYSYDFGNPDWEGTSTSATIWGLNENIKYFVHARAFDSSNNESEKSNVVTFGPTSPAPVPPPNTEFLEIGNLQVNHNWTQVTFNNSYTDPIVVARSFGMNGRSPAVIRIRNVDKRGFDIRIQEWPYISWTHVNEMVGFLVMERGSHQIGGVRVEAGRFATNNTNTFGRVNFNQSFNQKPVLISSIVSTNGPAAVTGRLRYINTQGFSYCMQEQQADDQRHKTEAIHYIAWEPSTGTAQNLIFDVGTTGDIVRDNFYRIYFHNSFSGVPSFLADMQTADGLDKANVRWRNKNAQSVEVQIDEEQSFDSETSHVTEVVGYIAVSPAN